MDRGGKEGYSPCSVAEIKVTLRDCDWKSRKRGEGLSQPGYFPGRSSLCLAGVPAEVWELRQSKE